MNRFIGPPLHPSGVARQSTSNKSFLQVCYAGIILPRFVQERRVPSKLLEVFAWSAAGLTPWKVGCKFSTRAGGGPQRDESP